MIPFNKPYLSGNELDYIADAVHRGKISGNGHYTKKCQDYFQERYNFNKCLLTSSCTDALEMAAILCNIQPNDEVIVPSYTFVSSANAFVLRGAKIVFADSREDHPGIDESKIESLITPNTRVIVIVHYAGVACDMDIIMNIANKYNLFVVEDAAQAINSFYKGKPLGGIGHFGCFSFHETKNIQCGEGGMLVINDDRFKNRAEIIWEKGTNRAQFFRGEVNKYSWVDIGSSFLPSELMAAFLYAQIENIDIIQKRRRQVWDQYYSLKESLNVNEALKFPSIPNYATNNAHMFYLVLQDELIRIKLIEYLKKNNVNAVFHYQSLHKSLFYKDKCVEQTLINSDKYSKCLIRLPFYYELDDKEIISISDKIMFFFNTMY